jgi:hypothetical protein
MLATMFKANSVERNAFKNMMISVELLEINRVKVVSKGWADNKRLEQKHESRDSLGVLGFVRPQTSSTS